MNTPDPADVHTGTDRVELTICIPGQCCRGYCVDDTLHDLTKDQADRVRDVVAARLQALTAELEEAAKQRDIFRRQKHDISDQRDAARAELAAANAELDRLAALKGRVDELAEYAERAQVAEATLDRVTAETESVIDAIEETFLPQLPSKALSYCAQEDVNAGLDAMRERFGLEAGR